MLRTASSLPLTGLLTLGSDPARFQTEPPACYRASWQLPGPDSHRQATTSLRTARSAAKSQRHLPFCWAHEFSGLAAQNLAASASPARSALAAVTAGLKVVATIDVGRAPAAVAANPLTNKIYVATR
jgi:DNA-binding beta-propeller fold protein YncE